MRGVEVIVMKVPANGCLARQISERRDARRRRSLAKVTRVLRAFTLIELMVVLAIIGVGAGLAAPNLSMAMRRANARADAQTVIDIITRARNRSRLSLCETRVSVTPHTITVSSDPSDPLASCKAMPTLEHKFNPSRLQFTPFDVAGTAKDPFIFTKFGGTAYSGVGRLAVLNKVTNETRYIDVYTAIGTVTETK